MTVTSENKSNGGKQRKETGKIRNFTKKKPTKLTSKYVIFSNIDCFAHYVVIAKVIKVMACPGTPSHTINTLELEIMI